MSNYKQYIADIYHCSCEWGIKITDDEMYMNLVEWGKEISNDLSVPDPSLYKKCAAYWNKLCDMYPN